MLGKRPWFYLGVASLGLTLLLAAGCDSLDRPRSHYASNLFAYLYPDQRAHTDTPTVPVLSLPLRVGIAFVPVDRGDKRTDYDSGDTAAFSEAQKQALLKAISGQFKDCPFVKSIEIVPTMYLKPRAGFANLDQIRTLFNVDVMTLVSYDQVQFTDQGLLSLTYWTVVGAYLVQGEKNDTRTMLDAAVYDIASRKLLFRAPGLGDLHGSSTPVNLSEELRRDSERGFQKAATNLVANLKGQLDEFRTRVKESPEDYRIIRSPGYTGASAFGGLEAAVIGGLGILYICLRRFQRA